MNFILKKENNEYVYELVKIGPITKKSFEINVNPGTVAIIGNRELYDDKKGYTLYANDCALDEKNMLSIYLRHENQRVSFVSPFAPRTFKRPITFKCEELENVKLDYSAIIDLKCRISDYVKFSKFCKHSIKNNEENSEIERLFHDTVNTSICSIFDDIISAYADGSTTMSEALKNKREMIGKLRKTIAEKWLYNYGIVLEEEESALRFNPTEDTVNKLKEVRKNLNDFAIKLSFADVDKK